MAIHPLSAQCHWIQSHNRALLAVSWLVGGAYAYIPIANTYTTKFFVEDRAYYQCNYDNGISELKRAFFTAINFVLTFAIPLAIMTFSYLSIMHKLRRQDRFITLYTATTSKAASSSKSSSSTFKVSDSVLLPYIRVSVS